MRLAVVFGNAGASALNAGIFADSHNPLNLGAAVACGLICIVFAVRHTA